MARLFVLTALLLTCAALPAQPARLRGMWVDVFHDGIKNPFQVRALVERAKRAGVNALFIQVRSRAQAYHNSAYEYRAPDAFPFFDGLAAVIREAHAANPPIQVHAWLNAHPLWWEKEPPIWPDHILFRHPDWLTQDPWGNKGTPVGYALDFGHPEVQDYLTRLYLEVVRKYDVDGIHFDFIRFGGAEWGYNPVSLDRFWASLSAEQVREVRSRSERLAQLSAQTTRSGATKENELFPGASGSPKASLPFPAGMPAPDDPLFSDWRRQQVTELVRRVTLQAKALRPNLIVSAAVVPWGDAPSKFEETAAYRRCFQDWRSWAREGTLDLLIPMLYFKESERGQWFRNWVAYCQNLKGGRTEIIAGIGNWLNSHDETLRQARLADERLDGVCFYSYASTNPFPGMEAELFNEQFYTRLAELARAAAPRPKGPPPLAGVLTVSETKGKLRTSFEARMDSPFGFEIRAGKSSAAVAPSIKAALASKDPFLLLDATVVLQVGNELRVTDGREEVTVRLPARADLPFLPRDRIAILGRSEGSSIRAEDVVWLGASAPDPVLAGTTTKPW
ncbi:MAG: hypothetical protein D6724_10605 [Armatimonadetes bacterium]|nr:MAG: hypothetical protein D6724_10605 [Armatimonadota bacterium]